MSTTDQSAVLDSQLDAALERLAASEGGAAENSDAAIARFASAW
jgi:hypothetical protein